MNFHTAMNYISRLFLICVFLVFPTTTYIGNTSVEQQQQQQQQSTGETVLCMMKAPDASTFPNVSIDFRLIDENLVPVTDMGKVSQNLQISEGGKPNLALSNVKSNPKEGGISFYLIVDKGNRSKQDLAKNILQSFSNYFNLETDEVKIYTDEENTATLYYPDLSKGNTLAQAISKFKTDKGTQPYQIMNSLNAVLDEIESNPFSCQKTSVIVMIVGDATLDTSKLANISERLKTSSVKLSLLHIPHPTDNTSFKDEGIYKTFTTRVRGDYVALTSVDQGGVTSVFDQLMHFRQTYSAEYHTNDGENGNHQVGASYNDTPLLVKGESSYNINLTPGQVKLSNDAMVIGRNKKPDGSYDKEAQTFQVTVSWPDGHILTLDPKANLHVVRSEDGFKKDIPVNLTEQANGIYEFSWVFEDIAPKDSNHFSITLEVFDEFGNGLTTSANNVIVNNLLPAPPPSQLPLWFYIIVGSVGFLVLVVSILVLILFLKFRNFSFIERGKQEAAKIVGEVKKTFIGGGGSRKKPLFILRVIEGPLNMVGQDLPVYTESVKLGRDDRKADLIFYGVDTNSSVSGLHARIERVGGLWRIVALSESGSETFINGAAISFNEPCELNPNDKIRLGYLARQAVELEFVTDIAGNKPPASNHKPTIPIHLDSDDIHDDDLDKTNISDDGQPDEDTDKTFVDQGNLDAGDQSVLDTGIKVSDTEKKKLRSEPTDDVDDIFEGLRNRK